MKKYLMALIVFTTVFVEAKEISLQDSTIPAAAYAKIPSSPDELIRDKKAVITSQAYNTLIRNPRGESTYHAVVDVRSEIFRAKAQFARYNVGFEIVCRDCANLGTFSVGFFDVKMTGKNFDIQRLLINQYKQNGFTILWIGLSEPTTFIDLISSFF